jgi:hypothetical protein
MLTSDQFAQTVERALMDYFRDFYIDTAEDQIFDGKDVTVEGSTLTVTVDTIEGGNSQRFVVTVRG